MHTTKQNNKQTRYIKLNLRKEVGIVMKQVVSSKQLEIVIYHIAGFCRG